MQAKRASDIVDHVDTGPINWTEKKITVKSHCIGFLSTLLADERYIFVQFFYTFNLNIYATFQVGYLDFLGVDAVAL